MPSISWTTIPTGPLNNIAVYNELVDWVRQRYAQINRSTMGLPSITKLTYSDPIKIKGKTILSNCWTYINSMLRSYKLCEIDGSTYVGKGSSSDLTPPPGDVNNPANWRAHIYRMREILDDWNYSQSYKLAQPGQSNANYSFSYDGPYKDADPEDYPERQIYGGINPSSWTPSFNDPALMFNNNTVPNVTGIYKYSGLSVIEYFSPPSVVTPAEYIGTRTDTGISIKITGLGTPVLAGSGCSVVKIYWRLLDQIGYYSSTPSDSGEHGGRCSWTVNIRKVSETVHNNPSPSYSGGTLLSSWSGTVPGDTSLTTTTGTFPVSDFSSTYYLLTTARCTGILDTSPADWYKLIGTTTYEDRRVYRYECAFTRLGAYTTTIFCITPYIYSVISLTNTPI